MLSLLLGFVCMASGISANKVILYALKPEFLVGIRMTGAALLLGTYTYFNTSHRLPWPLIKKSLGLLIVVALFTTYFPSNLKAYALAHMPSSKMAFFGTLDPFVTALYSYFIFNERLTLYKIVGILLGITGTIILSLSSSLLDEQLQTFTVFSYAELAAFWAIVLSRLGWIQAQQLLKKEVFTPVQLNTILMLFSGVVALMSAFFRGHMEVIPLLETPLTLFTLSPLSMLSSAGLLVFFLTYTIVVGNIFGYTLYAIGLKNHSPMFISLTSFLVPLFVAIFGWLFLNEPISAGFFLACGVTFLGVFIFYLGERKRLY